MDIDNLKNSEKSKRIRSAYRMWKIEALDEAGYFVIFQGFLESGKLKDISGNALKLYIYLGLNSNNFDGVVWHSNKKIGEYFDKSERTIRLWMNELEKAKLIKRMRLKYNEKVYTHLQPYTYKGVVNREDEFFETIEGELWIDEANSLYIRGNNIYMPVINSMHIEAWDNETNNWKLGKIETRRSLNYWFLDDSENINKLIYVFKSYDKKFMTEIDKNNTLKVRVLKN